MFVENCSKEICALIDLQRTALQYVPTELNRAGVVFRGIRAETSFKTTTVEGVRRVHMAATA